MYLDPMGGPALLSALWITEHFPALRRMGQVFHLSFGPSAALPRLKPR